MTALDALLAGDVTPAVFAWCGEPDRDLLGAARSAGWRTRALDTSQVHDAASFHAALAEQWALPGWFGRNLDAVWDVLGDLATSPLLVVWSGCASLAELDPQLTQTVLELFRDATVQATSFAVVVLDAPGSAALGVSDLDALS